LAVAALAACTASACTAHDDFACAMDTQCVAGTGAQGHCEESGFCSFPDDTCASGSRYGEYGPAGIGGVCVPARPERDAGEDAAEPGEVDAAIDAAGPADAAAPDAAVPDAAILPDAALPGTVVTFGERPTATFKSVNTDAWIDSANPTLNHGFDPQLQVDGTPARSALLRFDVSDLPANANIESVALRLYTTSAGAAATGSVGVYRVKQGWVEGSENGSPGTANWTERSTTAAWTTVGCGAPGSRDSTPMDELVPAAGDTEYTVALPASLVEVWRANSQNNTGIILVAEDAATAASVFVSSEGAASTKRPLLEVRYTLP
jgi:hypothetical protein